jgi:hypothetical protein
MWKPDSPRPHWEDETVPVAHVVAEDVEEADAHNGLGAKHGVDAQALAAKLRGAGDEQARQWVTYVRRWWAEGRTQAEIPTVFGLD